jgi:hypothetical protein
MLCEERRKVAEEIEGSLSYLTNVVERRCVRKEEKSLKR